MEEWILVTGGAGYVGSHCVLQILQAGNKVLVVDCLSNSSLGEAHTSVKLFIPFNIQT